MLGSLNVRHCLLIIICPGPGLRHSGAVPGPLWVLGWSVPAGQCRAVARPKLLCRPQIGGSIRELKNCNAASSVGKSATSKSGRLEVVLGLGPPSHRPGSTADQSRSQFVELCTGLGLSDCLGSACSCPSQTDRASDSVLTATSQCYSFAGSQSRYSSLIGDSSHAAHARAGMMSIEKHPRNS